MRRSFSEMRPTFRTRPTMRAAMRRSTGKYRSGHWDYQLNRYVYDDEKTETKKTTTTTQPSLSSPSVEYYRNVYGAGATKKEEPKKEAAKVAPQLETDWDDDDWENFRC